MSEELKDLEPEPLAKCVTCGCSLWMTDNDDDGNCDDCWIKAEAARTEALAKEYLDRAVRMAKYKQEEETRYRESLEGFIKDNGL